MRDNPTSAVHQLLSKSLNFYNLSKNLTKLIVEYGRKSTYNCSLFLTNQHLDNDVLQIIMQLDKHFSPITHICIGDKGNKMFIFSLSNKLHILRLKGFTVFGELAFGNDISFKHMLVYFNKNSKFEDLCNNLLLNLFGGFFLATENEIRLYAFQTLNKPYLKISMEPDEPVVDIYLLTPNHIAVATKKQKKLNIYNIHSTELVQRVPSETVRLQCVKK